jgi:predicted metal-dependent peptidase
VTAASRSTEVRERVAVARLWGASRFPYFASALFATEIVATPGLASPATDGSWRLYVDPAAVGAWTAAQLGSVLVHHVGHLLRDHGERAAARGVTDRQSHAWIRAADAEINDDLVDAGLHQPGEVVVPADFGAPPGLLAEAYFDLLRGHCEDHDRPAPLGACGSGADGLARPWDEPTRGPVSAESAHLLRRQTAHDLLAHARQAGRVPAGWQRWADRVLQPKVDWRGVLAAELRHGVARHAGSVDYSYLRPSRRAAVAGPVVLPSLRAPAPEVAVVCDTSGSVTDELLARVLAEVEGVIRAAGASSSGVRVLSCDAAVHTVHRATRASQVMLIGGGGTDMGAGISAAADLRPRPGVIVVLTDGRTPWPAAGPRGVYVVVGLLDQTAPPPPTWARVVRIDDTA